LATGQNVGWQVDESVAALNKPIWPHSGPLPQRFSTQYARYRERGGLIEVAPDAQAYAAQEKLIDKERFVFLSLAFDQIHKEGLTGDIVELGVYQGQTATILARNGRRLGRTVWLLDTFTGFDAKDFTDLDAGRGDQFADTSLEAVRARVGESNTNYIQGFFPDTAAQLPPDGRYCLVHIDCDLYAPIYSALEYFYPRMVPGGFMIVHDYGSLAWEGAEKAVDVFFADKPECIVPMPDSAGSAVARKQRGQDQAATWQQAKSLLPVGAWHAAAHGQLGSVLGNGWSRAEAWGVWGVGTSHSICLAPDVPVASFDIDLDVHAATPPMRAALEADVLLDGAPVARWSFTEAQNRGVRTLEVRREDAARTPVTIELRPASVLRPQEVNPASADTRPLGIALHRLRLRARGTP
jgi:hypothetical protein